MGMEDVGVPFSNRLTRQGNSKVPADLRDALKLKPGDLLVVEIKKVDRS